MDGVHQAGGDADAIVDRLDERREAVRGARRVGDHGVGVFQHLVVDAEDDGAVHVLFTRRGDDHLPRARLQVRAGFRLAGEQAGAFQDDIDAEALPRQLGRIALGDDADAIIVHHQAVAVDPHRAGELAVRGVVLQEVSVGRGVAQVVHRDELQPVLLAALVVGAQHHAADAAESVDGNLDRHFSTLLTASATR